MKQSFSVEAKAALKKALSNANGVFTERELQNIIAAEFFSDGNEMDIELIDAAIRRLANQNGVRFEEEMHRIAYEALHQTVQLKE